MDSSQFVLLGHQEFQEGSEQTFAPDAGVVYKLKEAQRGVAVFLVKCPDGVATTSATTTRTPRRC